MGQINIQHNRARLTHSQAKYVDGLICALSMKWMRCEDDIYNSFIPLFEGFIFLSIRLDFFCTTVCCISAVFTVCCSLCIKQKKCNKSDSMMNADTEVAAAAVRYNGCDDVTE